MTSSYSMQSSVTRITDMAGQITRYPKPEPEKPEPEPEKTKPEKPEHYFG